MKTGMELLGGKNKLQIVTLLFLLICNSCVYDNHNCKTKIINKTNKNLEIPEGAYDSIEIERYINYLFKELPEKELNRNSMMINDSTNYCVQYISDDHPLIFTAINYDSLKAYRFRPSKFHDYKIYSYSMKELDSLNWRIIIK